MTWCEQGKGSGLVSTGSDLPVNKKNRIPPSKINLDPDPTQFLPNKNRFFLRHKSQYYWYINNIGQKILQEKLDFGLRAVANLKLISEMSCFPSHVRNMIWVTIYYKNHGATMNTKIICYKTQNQKESVAW